MATVGCASAIVRTLESHGVDIVFGIPGTHSIALYGALGESSIRHITPRHEQGGGYAADGFARASGRPGVCIVTTGPGVTNIATAAATAYHDSVPMVVISPGMPTEVNGRDTGFLHEVKDQTGAMDCLVQWSRRVLSVAEAVAAIHDAFCGFASGRSRPVHIEVPLDVLESTGELPDLTPSRPSRRVQPDPTNIAAATAVLAEATAPCMVLGGGSVDATRESLEMAESLGAVVVTTAKGKGVLGESHPLSLGASLRLEAARQILSAADVVLAVGTELAESDLWTCELELRGRLIRIDIDADQLSKNFTCDVGVAGDAAIVLRAIHDALVRRPSSDQRLARGARRATEARAAIEAEALVDGGRYRELHEVIRDVLPADAIVTGDSAMISYFGTIHYMPMEHPRQFLYPVGYATLGYGLPAAIGAKLALPDRDVVAVMGDGGLMFTVPELACAAELGLPLPIVVENNRGYGEIRAVMRSKQIAPIGVDLEPPDFPALSRALGGHGHLVEKVSDVGPAVATAIHADRPTVIELRL